MSEEAPAPSPETAAADPADVAIDLRSVGVARSVVGTAACAGKWPARAAWREADYLGLLVDDEIRAATGRGIKGSAIIARLRKQHPIVSDTTTRVETKTEFLLLEAMLGQGLPRPFTNAELELPGRTYRPDMLYRHLRLVIEVDGGVHERADRRQLDALRDAHMRANGYEVLRIRKADIERDAEACARRVAAAIEARARALGVSP